MKKLIFFVSFFCVASHAEWSLFHTAEDKSQFFLDPETLIVVDGGYKRIWILNEFDQANLQGTKSFRSIEEYDCVKSLSRVMQIAAFKGTMASGQLLAKQHGSGQWKPIEPASVEETIREKVCSQLQ
jgi:hypothetical protein